MDRDERSASANGCSRRRVRTAHDDEQRIIGASTNPCFYLAPKKNDFNQMLVERGSFFTLKLKNVDDRERENGTDLFSAHKFCAVASTRAR